MTARSTANLLTRTTAILAACFRNFYWFGYYGWAGSKQTSIVDEVVNSTSEQPVPAAPQVPTGQ